jgi:oxygen-independent coproporphyrinogen-3 oxidase
MPASKIEMTVGAPLAVYVHWPFCLAKCPYCDFNSHVRETVDQESWRAALLAEIAFFAAETGPRRITSMFFGGGTPSLMPPATVAAVIDAVAENWGLDKDAEITLEANPTSVEAGRFADLRRAGVNRASLGVQALDDGALAFLGRGHSSAEAIAAVELAALHFPRHSLDLIYARPDQTDAAWRDELGRAMRLIDGHISVYQLTVEKGTPFHTAWRRGELHPPGDESALRLYETTQEVLEAAGLPAYEISNHARPGAECRHNLEVWRGGDYIGIGPGAHGRLKTEAGTMAHARHRAPEAWLRAVSENGHGTARHELISPAERLVELAMTGLRLSSGLERGPFEAFAGTTLEAAFEAGRMERLIKGGFMVLDKAGLRTTPEGRVRLDAVLAALLA